MRKLITTLCLIVFVLGSAGCAKHLQNVETMEGLRAFLRGDYAIARRIFEPLAIQGNDSAQFSLGLMYQGGYGVPQNNKTALKWYTLAAEQENASAQYSLGRMYGDGKGVPQNHETTLKWYTLAAEQGHAKAQLSLGAMYGDGKGVPWNYKTAEKWIRRAAEQGNAKVQELAEQLQKKITEAKASPPTQRHPRQRPSNIPLDKAEKNVPK